MTEEQNPYSPAIAESESLAEQIRRRSTWAAALGVAGVLVASIVAPLAVYFGHQCLWRIRKQKVGREHSGAALVGAALGWLGCAYLLLEFAVFLRNLEPFVNP